MSIAPDAREDRPAELARQIVPTAPWRDVSVKAESNYRLEVRFVDGTTGRVDIREMVASPKAGVFKALQDPDVFARVYVSLGAVTWPGKLDLAPDPMYDEIRAYGEWVLR